MSSVTGISPEAVPGARPKVAPQTASASNSPGAAAPVVTAAPDTGASKPLQQGAQQVIGGVSAPSPNTTTSASGQHHPIVGVDDEEPPRRNNPIIGVDDEYSYDEKGLKFRKIPGFRDVKPDYVIDVLLTTGEDSEAFNFNNVSKLIDALTSAGFYTEVRQGSKSSLLVFAKCSSKRLLAQYYREKTKDWLYNVSTEHPAEWNSNESSNFTPAEKLRLIYNILTAPPREGGIGITPDLGEWLFVNSIFPLHDYALNKEWIRRWSTKWTIDEEEINWIRNHFGEKHAFYFAFLQDYFLWLTIPTVAGVFTYFALGPYSKFHGVVSIIWGIIFILSWQRKERSLAYKWSVKGSDVLETSRALFTPETVITDPITGEQKGYYPRWKRALTQLSSIPLALGAVAIVVVLQFLSFSLEILIGQLYFGPLKSFFSLIPTLVLVGIVPIAVNIYATIVSKINDLENHETEDAYEISYTQKLVSLTFITSCGGVFLTAYLYLPFGHMLKPYVGHVTDFSRSYLSTHFNSPDSFDVNGARLQQQVLYLMGTAQVIKFAVSTVLPYVQRKIFSGVNNYRTAEENPFHDDPEESEFLEEVREQAKMPEHSVQEEYQEMIIQFSHIMLFGVVWPLAPLAALVNNWIELRGDAAKICVDMRRPIPSRAESIGPWLLDLRIVTWLASITIPSFVAMFGSTHHKFSSLSTEGVSLVDASAKTVLAYIIVSEHGYFFFSFIASFIMNSFQSDSQIKDDQARYYLRKISLASGASPVTLAGDLKQVGSGEKEASVNPAEAAWQHSSPAIVLQQTKEILHNVKEMNNQSGESKKTK